MKECACGATVSAVGIVQFQVQMRARRVTRIAADGDMVASLNGELIRRENHRQRILRTRALQLVFILVGKALQVAIDAGLAVRMADVDGIAEAIHVDRQSADIAVGNGEDVLTLHITRLNIDTSMEMERSRFTEVARQRDVVIDGTFIGDIMNADRLGFIRTAACQQ